MTTTVRWLSAPPAIGRGRLDEIARQAGLVPFDAAGTDLAVAVIWSADPTLKYDSVHRRSTDETYLLQLGATPDRLSGVTVTGSRGLRWALADLADRVRWGRWAPGDHTCGPAFAIRGVIEGFYGPPWTQEARLDMVDFASRHRFNTILYAPKNDPYIRQRWREPHDDENRQRLEEMIDLCRDRDLDTIVGVAPGLSMNYSGRRDTALLSTKAAALVDLGATRIALLLDDIPDRLQHPFDIHVFPDLATAQARAANQLQEVMPSDAPLVVCPTIYWGEGDEEYISRLADQLDPRIDLLWTGRAICSPAITASEAAHFTRATRRPPLYWDNYPVNDVAMRHEMHIGPYQNRDPLLDRFSQGVMANAMEYPEASKIALATIGDYLWDPLTYHPDQSWLEAIADVAGEADAAAVATFADNVRASCLSDPDPIRLTAALQRFAFEIQFGDAEAAGHQLSTFAEELGAAADHLLGNTMENGTLQTELRPWLTKFKLGAEAVSALATHSTTSSMAATGRELMTTFLIQLRNDPHRVFGDVLEMTIAELITGSGAE